MGAQWPVEDETRFEDKEDWESTALSVYQLYLTFAEELSLDALLSRILLSNILK